MRCAAYEQFGDPGEVLRVVDRPLPEPGSGEVRLRTILSPIHNHDLWTVRGSYGIKPSLPAIGGSEAVGIVDAVGEGVDPGLIGRRVAVASVQGSWAEAFLAKAGAVMPVPDAISDEAAAQLIAMPFSAITLLESLDVQPGEWIVQNAANGAVGRILATLAQARGIHVLNLVRREEGLRELAEAGIQNAVSTSDAAWKDRARELFGEACVKAGVDSVGGSASGDLAELISEKGQIVCFGSMTGEPMRLPSGPIIFKELTVRGFWGSKVGPSLKPEDRQRLMSELVTRVASGDLRLSADKVFPLAEICEAVRASLTPGKVGKVLVRP